MNATYKKTPTSRLCTDAAFNVIGPQHRLFDLTALHQVKGHHKGLQCIFAFSQEDRSPAKQSTRTQCDFPFHHFCTQVFKKIFLPNIVFEGGFYGLLMDKQTSVRILFSTVRRTRTKPEWCSRQTIFYKTGNKVELGDAAKRLITTFFHIGRYQYFDIYIFPL